MTIEQIVALLLGIAPQARKDGLTQMARTIALMGGTDDEIKKICEGIKPEQIENFIRDWRKDADQEITKATQTAEANLRNKYDFVEKGKQQQQEPPAQPEAITEEAMKKAIAEAVEKAIGGYKAEQQDEALKAARKDLLSKSFSNEVPTAYKDAVLAGFEGRTFEKDDDFNAYLEKVKADTSTFMQDLANRGLRGHEAPTLGAVNEKTGVSQAVEAYVAEQKAAADGKNTLGGKAI